MSEGKVLPLPSGVIIKFSWQVRTEIYRSSSVALHGPQLNGKAVSRQHSFRLAAYSCMCVCPFAGWWLWFDLTGCIGLHLPTGGLVSRLFISLFSLSHCFRLSCHGEVISHFRYHTQSKLMMHDDEFFFHSNPKISGNFSHPKTFK